jgi:hypothetical protein
VVIIQYGGEKSLHFIIQKQWYSGKAINSGPSCGWQYSLFEAACGRRHAFYESQSIK